MVPDILITFIIKTRARKDNFSDGFKVDSLCNERRINLMETYLSKVESFSWFRFGC